MSLRDIKTKARSALHDAMKVPAYYFAAIGDDPVECSVRVHSKFRALGDISTMSGLSERIDETPRLVFLVSEVTPVNKSFVTISASEGYQIDHLEPDDGITVTAIVSRLSSAKLASLTYPGG
jgi:hypothetical protein